MALVCIPLTYAKIIITAIEGWKSEKKKKKGSKTISSRVCVLLILINFKNPSRHSLRWQRLYDNYHSYEINTCLPPKLKSADNVYDGEERLTISHVKILIHM